MAFYLFKMYLLYGIKLFLALTKMESLLTLVHMDAGGFNLLNISILLWINSEIYSLYVYGEKYNT